MHVDFSQVTASLYYGTVVPN